MAFTHSSYHTLLGGVGIGNRTKGLGFDQEGFGESRGFKEV